MLSAQLDRVRAVERTSDRMIPFLFPHLQRAGIGGERSSDFRKAWADRLPEGRVTGRLRHDFRRTAVRNLVNAGVRSGWP